MGEFAKTNHIQDRTQSGKRNRNTSCKQAPKFVAVPEKNTAFTIRLYSETKLKLNRICKQSGGYSQSDIITSMIEDWVKRYYPECAQETE